MIPQKLGQMLLQSGRITQGQLAEAISTQDGRGRLLGDVLVDLGYVTPEDIAQALAMLANKRDTNPPKKHGNIPL